MVKALGGAANWYIGITWAFIRWRTGNSHFDALLIKSKGDIRDRWLSKDQKKLIGEIQRYQLYVGGFLLYCV